MSVTGRALPDGQLFMVSDRMLLADDVQAITVLAGAFGEAKWDPQVHLTVQGRINKSVERSDITIALNLEGIEVVLQVLLHQLTVIERAEKEQAGN